MAVTFYTCQGSPWVSFPTISGVTNNGSAVNALMARADAGGSGFNSLFSLGSGATNACWALTTSSTDVGWTAWGSGTYTVRLNVTLANMWVSLTRVIIRRLNSSGTVQATIADQTVSVSLASTGVASVDITGGTAQTATATDLLQIVFVFTNNNAMASQSFELADTGALQEAPFTDGAFDLNDWRWRNDDGSESTATWAAAARTSIAPAGGQQRRLRVEVENTINTSGTEAFAWQYRKDGGSWTALPAAGTSSVPVRFYNSTNLTDAGTTTQQLGSATFNAGRVYETAHTSTATFGTSGTVSELEAAIEFVAGQVTGGEVYDFRVVRSGGTTLATYTHTATATIATATLAQQDWRWYEDSGGESAASPLVATNTTLSVAPSTTVYRLRTVVAETADVPVTQAFQLQYQLPDFNASTSSTGYAGSWNGTTESTVGTDGGIGASVVVSTGGDVQVTQCTFILASTTSVQAYVEVASSLNGVSLGDSDTVALNSTLAAKTFTFSTPVEVTGATRIYLRVRFPNQDQTDVRIGYMLTSGLSSRGLNTTNNGATWTEFDNLGYPGTVTYYPRPFTAVATSGSSHPVLYANSQELDDQGSATQVLSAGTFDEGIIYETAHTGTVAFTGDSATELLAAVEFTGSNVAAGDVVTLRWAKSSDDALDSYAALPTITYTTGPVTLTKTLDADAVLRGALLSATEDAFNTLNTVLWDTDDIPPVDGTIQVVNGELELSTTVAGTLVTFGTREASYWFDEFQISLRRLSLVGADSYAMIAVGPNAFSGLSGGTSDSYVMAVVMNGDLQFYDRSFGTTSPVGSPVTYSAASHARLKFHWDSGELVLSTGTIADVWTEHTRYTPVWSQGDPVGVLLEVGADPASGTASAFFDDLNLPSGLRRHTLAADAELYVPLTTVTRYVNTNSTAGGDGTTNATSGANRAYASLAEAQTQEVAARANLVSRNEILRIECSGTAADGGVTWSGWTTDATRYIEVVGDNTSGVWDDTKYHVVTTNATAGSLNTGCRYIRHHNIQWSYSRSSGTSGFEVVRVSSQSGAADVRFYNCMARATSFDAGTSGLVTAFGSRLVEANQTTAFVNCVAWGFATPGGSGHGFRCNATVTGTPQHLHYNCTVYDSDSCFVTGSGAAAYSIYKNCLAQPVSGGAGFTSSPHTDSTNNLSSTASAPGANAITSATVTFVDAANGDFHLAGSDTSGAATGGATLSADSALAFDFDIDGETRTEPWSIGADQPLGWTYSHTLSADAVLQTTQLRTLAADVVLSQVVAHVLVASAVLSAQQTHTAAADAVLQDTALATLVSDVVLQATDTRELNADVVLQGTASATFDGSAVLQRADSHVVAADAVLLATIAHTTHADAVLQDVQVATLDADAVLQDTQRLVLHATSVLTLQQQHTTEVDAVLLATATRLVHADAVLQDTTTVTTDGSAQLYVSGLHPDRTYGDEFVTYASTADLSTYVGGEADQYLNFQNLGVGAHLDGAETLDGRPTMRFEHLSSSGSDRGSFRSITLPSASTKVLGVFLVKLQSGPHTNFELSIGSLDTYAALVVDEGLRFGAWNFDETDHLFSPEEQSSFIDGNWHRVLIRADTGPNLPRRLRVQIQGVDGTVQALGETTLPAAPDGAHDPLWLSVWGSIEENDQMYLSAWQLFDLDTVDLPYGTWTEFATISADAVLQATAATTISADAVLLATQTATVASDATLTASQVLTTTADAVLQQADTIVVAADAVLQASSAHTLTADALLRHTTQRTVAADAWLRSTVLQLLVSDAVLRATTTRTLSADARLLGSAELLVSADAVLQDTRTGTLNADAVLRRTTSATVDADAIVQRTVQTALAADAMLVATRTAQVTADAVIRMTGSTSLLSDAVLQDTTARAVAADAVLVGGTTMVCSATAVLQATASHVVLADAVLQASVTTSLLGDAVLRAGALRSVAADAVLEGGTTRICSADAVLVATQTATTSADAVVAKTTSLTSDADAVLLSIATTTVSGDAVLQRTESSTLEVSAVLQQAQVATLTADALLRQTAQVVLVADAELLGIGGLTVAADAVLQQVGSRALVADVVLQTTVPATVAADAWLRRTTAHALAAEAVVQGTATQLLVSDAVLQETHESSVDADAVLGRTTGHLLSADAVLVTEGTQLTAAADAVLQARSIVTFTAAAVLATAQQQTLLPDAELIYRTALTLAATARLKYQRPKLIKITVTTLKRK